MTLGDLVAVLDTGSTLAGEVGVVTSVSRDGVWVEFEGRGVPLLFARDSLALAESLPAAAGDEVAARALERLRSLLARWPGGWRP